MRLIDGDWLLNVVENIIDWDTERDRNRIIHQVRELTPIIEPQRKKGKWINIREGNRADCDQCGQSGRAWMNFCFLCGADMREDGEANE